MYCLQSDSFEVNQQNKQTTLSHGARKIPDVLLLCGMKWNATTGKIVVRQKCRQQMYLLEVGDLVLLSDSRSQRCETK